ncbi:MAG: class C sortase [Atopobiaceae bacterium]|nr:class C sortase [Atopobiaceae bacterium]
MAELRDIQQLGREAQGGRPARAPRRRGPSLSTLVLCAMLLLGAGIIAYPTFSDWWNSYHQSRVITTYATRVEETDPKVLERMRRLATWYNENLLTKDNRYEMTDEERAEYESLLDIDGSGVMGYVQVSSLGINYPIYHGIDESVLQIAIGHIEGTSLPVGGANTHCAVSGHRGLPRAKLFSDLDKMREGELFTVTVLDETLTYEVDQIRIVDPTDMSDLNFAAGEDLMTLVTCTPYGINTHRLLVRGHRVENVAELRGIPAEAIQIPNYIAVPAVGIPMLFAYLVGSLLYYRLHREGYDADEVMAELERMRDGEAVDGGET